MKASMKRDTLLCEAVDFSLEFSQGSVHSHNCLLPLSSDPCLQNSMHIVRWMLWSVASMWSVTSVCSTADICASCFPPVACHK